jgi:F-box domain
MGDVSMANQPIPMEERGPESTGLDKATKARGETTVINQIPLCDDDMLIGYQGIQSRAEEERTRGADGATVIYADKTRKTTNLASIPNELHLEILRRFDVPSIFNMRAVNRHFRELIESNQDTILRSSLHNVDCIGPHRILLRQFLPNENGYTLEYAKQVYKTKQTVVRVGQICRITTNTKIDALYCIYHICARARGIYALVGHNIDEKMIDHIRAEVFSEFTTAQLQEMLSISVRLVFKVAELTGYTYYGAALDIATYTICNAYLIFNGLEVIVEVERQGSRSDKLAYVEQWEGWADPAMTEIPRLHDELIKVLWRRGGGLLTDPGMEIQAFLQEEDTILDLRQRSQE